MSIKISHTAKQKYLLSPRSYFYHYHLYLREKVAGSPLFFGSLIENGLNALFAGATLEQALETFRKGFKTTKINGIIENLATSEFVRYSKADLDPDIFTEQELKILEDKTHQFKSWFSLQRKGELLITAYYNDIFKRIKKVIAVQEEFTIDNGAGDEITGFVDLICEWEDGRIIVPDHKTSSQSVKELMKNESYQKQTALYFEALKDKYSLDATGFFVLEKNIRKREPRTRTAVELFVPSEELIQKTVDEFENVIYNIKQGSFSCNSPNCDAYGQECCYKKYCASGGEDMTGLVKVNGYKK